MSSGSHESPAGDLERAGGVFEDDALIDRVNRALRSMWSRLEALPRSDEFWSGTNHRVTWSKVDDFAERCLRRDPSDETARRALVGRWMRAGSFDGLDLLAQEVPTRDGALADLIAVAEWVWLEVGLDPGADLERALVRAGPAVVRRLATSSGGRVGRAAAAASVFLDGKSFADAIGRGRWEMFLHALVVPAGAGGRTLAAARECLSGDASAVVDLLDAAQWWSVYRDANVMDRLRELLQAVPRRELEQLARDRHGGLVPAVRTALLVLDGHGLTPPVDG